MSEQVMIDGLQFDYDFALSRMDGDIADIITKGKLWLYTPQEFTDIYCDVHEEYYGEEFIMWL